MTRDGLRLAAWFMPGVGARVRASVLVLHGNGGNRANRADLATALTARGYSVLLTDYRGYGGNPGKPTEQGLAEDARAALAWLRSQRGVDPDGIVLFGESLGSAVAVALAAEVPVAALILRSPLTELRELARHHYPRVPAALLPDHYPAIDQIASVQAPTLVIAGDRDTIVPLTVSARLYDAAPGPKRLVVIPGADHNDHELLAGARMLNEMTSVPRRARGLAVSARHIVHERE